MEYVGRIHLKTGNDNRQNLIEYCLKGFNQYLVLGWSRLSGDISSDNFLEYFNRVKQDMGRANPGIIVFRNAKPDDLFWTRDLEGCYWICKVKAPVEVVCDTSLDIGVRIQVEAYNFGLQVPGQIKASFNRPRSGTVERIRDKIIIEYSKFVFNQVSNSPHYEVDSYEGQLLDNLPDFDLEELVISYLQINENYYVLSNSIANKSTTIKIECELLSRDKDTPRKAVVQVKGKKAGAIDVLDYEDYVEQGYVVYLYAPLVKNLGIIDNVIEITNTELLTFYNENRSILPASITQWENLFGTTIRN